jgi:hypothetical protein
MNIDIVALDRCQALGNTFRPCLGMGFVSDFADQAVTLPGALTIAVTLLVQGWRRGAGNSSADVGIARKSAVSPKPCRMSQMRT